MAIHQLDEIRYFTFTSLKQAGVIHGIFMRSGGVSPAPWASLNVGGMVGDSAENVIENRRRIFTSLERKVDSLYDCWLIHSNDAIRVESPRPLGSAYAKADIIVTNRPEISLFMRFADCVPILLHDPIKRVIALAHAGWVGTLNRVAQTAVNKMYEWYQSQANDIHAYIGPSIAKDHYPVGFEVVEKATAGFGKGAERFIYKEDGKYHLDLWEANQVVLEQAGVQEIEISGICTACHKEDWFSHRAEKGKTGRFGTLLALG